MKELQIKINVNFKIIPFGYASIEVKGREEEKEEREKESSVYSEPKTTNPQLIEITFGGENYGIPKTTGGIL
jgi:hypothetical protein